MTLPDEWERAGPKYIEHESGKVRIASAYDPPVYTIFIKPGDDWIRVSRDRPYTRLIDAIMDAEEYIDE